MLDRRGHTWLDTAVLRALLGALSTSLALVVAAPSAADVLTVGGLPDTEGDRSFVPFGGLSPELKGAIDTAFILGLETPVPRYQQVYDAVSFGDVPLRINTVQFAETVEQISNAGALGGTDCFGGLDRCGLFTLRIATTSAQVNALDTADLEANLPDTGTEIFEADILLSDILDDDGVLTFAGVPFLYDPNQGNLILDFQISNFSTSADLTQGMSTLFFEATDEDGFPLEDPPYSLADNFSFDDNSSFGLVTTFGFDVIPEPSTGLLFGAGLVGMAHWRRSQRRR